jgi:hypothetical protein
MARVGHDLIECRGPGAGGARIRPVSQSKSRPARKADPACGHFEVLRSTNWSTTDAQELLASTPAAHLAYIA